MVTITVDAERLREVCERYGVARLEVFGSVSRGEAPDDSDIDLLYELKSRSSWATSRRVWAASLLTTSHRRLLDGYQSSAL